MLEDLAFDVVDFRSIHQDIIDKKTPNTGETFTAKPEVEKWMNRQIKVLWIIGGRKYMFTYLQRVSLMSDDSASWNWENVPRVSSLFCL